MNYRPFIPIGIASLVLVVSIALYGVGYYFLTSASASAATLASQAASKKAELERATRAHVALGALETDEANLNQYAITKKDVVPFLESLQSAGKPYGASVNVVSVSDEQEGKHARVALTLTISGSFDSVMRTLGTIEYSPYDSVVRNVILETHGADEKGATAWTATVAYSIGLRTASSTPPKP